MSTIMFCLDMATFSLSFSASVLYYISGDTSRAVYAILMAIVWILMAILHQIVFPKPENNPPNAS